MKDIESPDRSLEFKPQDLVDGMSPGTFLVHSYSGSWCAEDESGKCIMCRGQLLYYEYSDATLSCEFAPNAPLLPSQYLIAFKGLNLSHAKTNIDSN